MVSFPVKHSNIFTISNLIYRDQPPLSFSLVLVFLFWEHSLLHQRRECLLGSAKEHNYLVVSLASQNKYIITRPCLRPWRPSPILCQGSSGISASFILSQHCFQASNSYSSRMLESTPGVLARMLKINS